MGLSDDPQVAELISLAVREDLGQGDLTASLLPNPDEWSHFELVAKQPGVLAGCDIAPAILRLYNANIVIKWAGSVADGSSWSRTPTKLAEINGPLGAVLSAERVLLNFLQRMSGVATITRAFVEAVAQADAKIYDTRKTTPGWRLLEKYAVRCGGGHNHRTGLFDAVLIKDNHLAGVPAERMAFAVFEMLNRLSGNHRPDFIQVECASLEQLDPLLSVVGIDSILLDNFSIDELRRAVALREALGLAGKIAFEASGGVTLATVRAVAETGVDRISVGALTHSAVAIDLSLDRIGGQSPAVPGGTGGPR